MTVIEFYKSFATLTPDKLRELAIRAVHENSETVIQDAIVGNAEGLTFAGNQIADYPPFSDWEETGEFHDNLKFESEKDISLTSRGKGAESIFKVFPYSDTIAPTAKILDQGTKSDITKAFIEQIKNTLR